MRKKVYIRKLHNNHYYVISGMPENHRNNKILGEFHTRRQAVRNAKSSGYELVVQSRKPAQAAHAQ